MKQPKILITDSTSADLIKQLAAESTEAFYVCDLNDVAKKYYDWIEKIPRVKPYYAVKCNPHREVLQTLAALGANFDCASKAEIKEVLSIGVPPDRIIFANPTKLIGHLQYASTKNVKRMTFDCEEELYKIKKYFPEAETVLRIRYDDPKALYSLGRKFGCDPDTEVEGLLQTAKALKITVVGVAFHIGSSSQNPDVFWDAIKKSSQVFQTAKEMGFNFELLDIGGGYLGEIGTSIDPTAKVINSALAKFFPDPSIKIISEPGRYFVSSAFTLSTTIHTVKTKYTKQDHEEYFEYYIDEGVYTSFIAVLFDETLPGGPLKDSTGLTKYRSTVWGPTCDSFDRVLDDVMLPQMHAGDWMVFPNMGAYTLSISTPFNGFSTPKIYTMANKKIWKIIEDRINDEHVKV